MNIKERKEVEKELKDSEAKFRAIAEESPLGVVVVQDREIKYYNPRLAEIAEIKPEEIGNWKPMEFMNYVYPKDRPKIMKRFLALESGASEKETEEVRIITKTQKTKYLSAQSKLINWGGEKASLGLIEDIDEKKRLKELSNEVFNSAPVGIVIIDQEGKIIRANPAQFSIDGVETDDYTIMNGVKIMEVEEVKKVGLDKIMDTVLKTREPFKVNSFDFPGTIGGKHVYVDIFFKPISDDNTLIIVHDVTDQTNSRIYLEESLRELKELKTELEEQDWIQKNIIRKVSHNLRNYAQSFNNVKYLMDSNKLGTSQIKTVSEEIKSVWNSMDQESLIYELLLRSGSPEKYKFESLDIKLAINEILDKYKSIVKDTVIEVREEIFRLDPIKCDPIITHVLRHLIDNSIKAISESKYKKIELGYIPKEKEHVFYVGDSGKGMSKDEVEKLFTIPKDPLGVEIGLGLYICKKIIKDHHGEIWAESDGINKGSKFYFSIPKDIGKMKGYG